MLLFLVTIDADLLFSLPELQSTLPAPSHNSLVSSQSRALQASLALWRYTAEKVTAPRQKTVTLSQLFVFPVSFFSVLTL